VRRGVGQESIYTSGRVVNKLHVRVARRRQAGTRNGLASRSAILSSSFFSLRLVCSLLLCCHSEGKGLEGGNNLLIVPSVVTVVLRRRGEPWQAVVCSWVDSVEAGREVGGLCGRREELMVET
jgi:hypothetical protein